MSLEQEDRELVMSLVKSVNALTSSVGQLIGLVADLLAEREGDTPEPDPATSNGLDDD